MRPTWPKNMLRQRPCSESRNERNGQNVKRKKRQELLRKRGWNRRPGNWQKKSNAKNKRKNNTRRIWLINLKWTVSPPLSNNGAKIG